MRKILALRSIRPELSQLFDGQGRQGQNITAQESAAVKALDILQERAEFKAIVQDVTKEEFKVVFIGEGLNDLPNPMERIFPEAASLSLFAFTLGNRISSTIDGLFAAKDFLLGYFLDKAASLASEGAVREIETSYAKALKKQSQDGRLEVLSYSPGYCGWHISAQKKLFLSLHPEEIGIRLTGGFLMEPLKSVTGVLVAAEPRIHRFKPKYPFCRLCRDHTCQERQLRVMRNE